MHAAPCPKKYYDAWLYEEKKIQQRRQPKLRNIKSAHQEGQQQSGPDQFYGPYPVERQHDGQGVHEANLHKTKAIINVKFQQHTGITL